MQLAERWREIIHDPVLHVLEDLPYKFELDKWGNILMSPASNQHNDLQSEILVFLRETFPTGRSFVECSIETPEGVKVPDVVWCSAEFFHQHGLVTPYPMAPEICIEVLSPSNSMREMAEKTKLYLAQGAQEVWLVKPDGSVEFYTRRGRRKRSKFVKKLPSFLH